MKNKPLVIAHRGYSGKFPENTMAAFRAAIEAGAGMIELDVHLTREGSLLVTHDFELGRCSGGQGTLASHNEAELRALDAGSWFHPRFSGERFPLLSEVLELARGRIELNIELKEETLTSQAAYERMTAECLALVDRFGMVEQVVVSSFEWRVLEQLRAKSAAIRLGLLNHEPERGLRWSESAAIRPYSYHPNHEPLTPAHVAEIHGRGLKLLPYTANTEESFRKLLTLGADGIITNEVEKLQAFLDG